MNMQQVEEGNISNKTIPSMRNADNKPQPNINRSKIIKSFKA